MNNKSYVLVYDSGVGGLTTLASCSLIVPNAKFLYFADVNNLPYGNKSSTKLQELILQNVEKLMKTYHISHIILACNTATTSSINFLREKIDNIPIIGTEPNIKAPITLGFKHISLLATPLTISQEKLISLEEKLHNSPNHISSKLLAKTIESYKLSGNSKQLKRAIKLIERALLTTPKNSAVVLGCTHYVFIKKHIEKMGYKCFDGNAGVARRLKSLFTFSENISSNNPQVKFVGLDNTTKLKYKKIFLNYYKSLKKEQSSRKLT